MKQTLTPFKGAQQPKDGVVFFSMAVALAVWSIAGTTAASDGATEALELRLHAEHAIADEAAAGDAELAKIMTEILPGLLVDDLVTRDETITLDTVDAAFVQEQFAQAEMMDEPGIAMALGVFAGPGTGFEHGIRNSLANLADFTLRKEGNLPATSNAIAVHERVMAHHLAKLDALDKADAKADKLADKAAEVADKAAEEAVKVAAKLATKTAEAAAKEAVNADKEADKAAEEEAKAAEKDSGTSDGGGGPPEGKGGGKKK